VRRTLLLLSFCALALAAAQPAAARSWAQPQIRVVVEQGLMGPSVAGFRPNSPLTRGDVGQATAILSGKEQVVVDPGRPVRMRELERWLTRAAGLGRAARLFKAQARAAGLRPPSRFGAEVVVRLLGLRVNHLAARDGRELRPQDVATRAEGAYSFARLFALGDWSVEAVAEQAEGFRVPRLTAWQRRVLARAFSFVGYPYVWGGTSESTQTLFGVTSRGGFDCSGFVWRVYKLQPFDGAPQLSSVLRGRTTYAMSGEFPRRQRVTRRNLRPGDLIFFGARGPRSQPAEVDHMGIYVGRGWFVHSSSQGTTLATLDGWYADRFAWGRRPLREAGLS
jgi:cell wall-associated NlpC family hydrolase